MGDIVSLCYARPVGNMRGSVQQTSLFVLLYGPATLTRSATSTAPAINLCAATSESHTEMTFFGNPCGIRLMVSMTSNHLLTPLVKTRTTHDDTQIGNALHFLTDVMIFV
jgi:hypothetical protein